MTALDQPDLAEPDGVVESATSAKAAEIAALQAALAAEHAAVYGYGVVGAMLSGAAGSLAHADWLAHQEARDTLEAMLVKLGATPVAAEPGLPAAVPGHRRGLGGAAGGRPRGRGDPGLSGSRGGDRPNAAIFRRAGDAAAREPGPRLARQHGRLPRNADDSYWRLMTA